MRSLSELSEDLFCLDLHVGQEVVPGFFEAKTNERLNKDLKNVNKISTFLVSPLLRFSSRV